MQKSWYQDKVLLAILLAAAVLALANLGDRHFWGDEVHLLNLGKSIAQHGLPVVDDELKAIESTYEIDDLTQKTFSETLTYGIRIAGKDVYSLHPWLVSYVVAPLIAAFGPHEEFLLRLPFVLIGLLAIPITFALALCLSKKRRVALLSAALLAGSVAYLLALRNANYYGLILFAVPTVLLCYLRTLEDVRHAWWQFALVGTMLFHSQWLVFMGTMLGIAAHFVIFHRNLPDIKRIARPLAGIFILTFPWFVLTGQFAKTSAFSTPMQYLSLLSISAYHFVLWFVPLILLVFVPRLIVSGKRRWKIDQGYALLALTILLSLLFTSLNYYTGTPIRYYYGLLPLAMILNATIIDKFWKWNRIGAVMLVILLVTTNIVHVLPLLPFKPLLIMAAGSQDVLGTGAEAQTSFVEKTIRPRVLTAEYLFEITHNVVSPTQAIMDAILNASTKGKELFVGVGDANTIGYYTGLRPATYANNFKTRTYDWIVLSTDDERNTQVDRQTFTRAWVPYGPERWGDTADPVHHVFRTSQKEGFYLYRRKA